jgi:type IV secretory pathway TraG/TraD family ATPase VirD4
MPKNQITPFAVTDFRNSETVFGIKAQDRLSHLYVLGKTGTGKTTLLKNMIISDIQNGNGLAVIDPHGDLAESLLDFIPEERIQDTIYLNPADQDFPFGFNPLENVDPQNRHLIASNLITVLKKIWSEFWGPRMEYILRNAILTLLEYPGSTLIDLQHLLSDKDFRNRVLEKVETVQIKDFWQKEFDKYSAWLKSDAVSPIQNKVGQFLTAPILRNIFAQKKSVINFRKVMDKGKILIVNLAKGKIGEDMCALVGSLFTTSFELSALSRSDIPEENRKPFYLYIDEVQSFITQSFANMLSESRKYRLGLILAHQYLEQLDESIRHSLFGNAGTLITFRLGQEDAHIMAREFHPVFEEADIINLPNHHIYLKLMIDGISSQPFSARTLQPIGNKNEFREIIIGNCRALYARPKEEVEKEILAERNLKNSFLNQ